MVDSVDNFDVSQPKPIWKKRSLLEKYEIPVDNLSYEFIGKCDNVKTLERIVRILRSGEEGFYPDLQKTAEDRLRLLKPTSRQLRVVEPVLTKNSMKNAEWDSILKDVSTWKKEVSIFDMALSEESNKIDDSFDPPVRQLPLSEYPMKNRSDEVKSIAKNVKSYEAWDKYDADTELLKMDLEQEQKKDVKKKHQQVEVDRHKLVLNDVNKLTDIERQLLAEQEKNRGNEYYQEKNYKEAIKYYTASITIWPTSKAYNNRAACYVKQCKYSAVLADTNSVLELEPDNVKALFRRGIALQHTNKLHEALHDIQKVLLLQPNDILAQSLAEKLREKILTTPNTTGMLRDQNITVFENNRINTYNVNGQSLQHNSQKCISFPNQLASTPDTRIVELSEDVKVKESSTRLKIIEVEDSCDI